MKLMNILTVLVVVLVLAYIANDALGPRDPVRIAALDTMALIGRHRDIVRDTIRVKEKAKARVDSVCCKTITDTQLVIQPSPTAPPETVTVRTPIIERIRTDSALLASLYVDRRLDSLWHIQDAKLPHKASSRWGLTLGPGYVCNEKGCGVGASITFSYRIGR